MSTDSSKPTDLKTGWPKVTGSVIVGLVALFGSQIIAGLLILIYPLIRHWSAAQGNSWLTNSVLAQFIFVVLSETIALGLVYLFLKRTKISFESIGLRRPKWSDIAAGLMGIPVWFVIYLVTLNIILIFAPHLNVGEKQQVGFNNVHGSFDVFLAFISLVILPPIAEEIIFRGLIFSSFRKRLNLWMAMILTSLLFAAGHLPEGGSAGPLYVAGIDTFSLSLVLVYIREKTNGLYAGMLTHGLKNLIAFIVLVAMHSL